jgi:hypothetical protein
MQDVEEQTSVDPVPEPVPEDPTRFELLDPIPFGKETVKLLKFPSVLKAKHVRRLGANPDGFTVEMALKIVGDMCALPDETLGEMTARDAARLYERMTRFLLVGGFLRTL